MAIIQHSTKRVAIRIEITREGELSRVERHVLEHIAGLVAAVFSTQVDVLTHILRVGIEASGDLYNDAAKRLMDCENEHGHPRQEG